MLLIHADAGVLDPEADEVLRVDGRFRVEKLLVFEEGDLDLDLPLVGEFQAIADEVDEDLHDPHEIADYLDFPFGLLDDEM